MLSHLVVGINLKVTPILEINKNKKTKQLEAQGSYTTYLNNLLVFYYYVINSHKFSNLKQHKFPISKCLCIRSPGTS